MNRLKLIGGALSITGFILLCYIYDWKLAIIIALIIVGNNLEQKIK